MENEQLGLDTKLLESSGISDVEKGTDLCCILSIYTIQDFIKYVDLVKPYL